ncbi:hypothetical protein DB345_01675 [Spartobacteria bacterium LR76]|nr:hypothetical protein DB345_01675 [Spartobacteria bacterium LR76]
MGQEIVQQAAELGRQAARNYLEYGSSVPSLVERLSIEKRKLEERVAAQSQRTAQLETELESARNATKDAQVELHKLAETKGTVEKLEQDRLSLSKKLVEAESEIARALAILKPDSKEHLPSAVTCTANLATCAQAARSTIASQEKENAKLQSELDRSQQTIGNLENELGPLRKIRDAMIKLLDTITAKGLKFSAELTAMLQEIAELLGKKFSIKKKPPEQKINMG